ncbi:MAG TPA: Flp family type IVb pilin [Bryobacteraceae bacterium]|nr:Flp family type IVb pilin [Bryobacteraceae bacterium]
MNYYIVLIANRLRRLAGETKGQDLIEYALMAGFLAVAAAAVMPNIGSTLSTIFSQVTSVLSSASSQS